MATDSAESTSEEVTEGGKFASIPDKSERVYPFFTRSAIATLPRNKSPHSLAASLVCLFLLL